MKGGLVALFCALVPVLLFGAAQALQFVEPTSNTNAQYNSLVTVQWDVSKNDSQAEPERISLFLLNPPLLYLYKPKEIARNIQTKDLRMQFQLPSYVTGNGWKIVACDNSKEIIASNSEMTCAQSFNSQDFSVAKPADNEPYKVVFSSKLPKEPTEKDEFQVQVQVVDKNGAVVQQMMSFELQLVNRMCAKLLGRTTIQSDDGKALFQVSVDKPFIFNATLVARARKLGKDAMWDEVPVPAVSEPFDIMDHENPDPPTELHYLDVRHDSVVLQWNAPKESSPAELSHYEIEVVEPSCCKDWRPPVHPAHKGGPVVLNCLCPDTIYHVRVYTVDSHGLKSFSGRQLSFHTREAPDAQKKADSYKFLFRISDDKVAVGKLLLLLIVLGTSLATSLATCIFVSPALFPSYRRPPRPVVQTLQ